MEEKRNNIYILTLHLRRPCTKSECSWVGDFMHGRYVCDFTHFFCVIEMWKAPPPHSHKNLRPSSSILIQQTVLVSSPVAIKFLVPSRPWKISFQFHLFLVRYNFSLSESKSGKRKSVGMCLCVWSCVVASLGLRPICKKPFFCTTFALSPSLAPSYTLSPFFH